MSVLKLALIVFLAYITAKSDDAGGLQWLAFAWVVGLLIGV